MAHETPPLSDATTLPARSQPVDAMFEALAHEYRRAALRYLLTTDGTAAFDALASQVAAEAADAEQSRVEVLLHHNHLPKLADFDLIEYHDGTVALTETGRSAEPVLEALSET